MPKGKGKGKRSSSFDASEVANGNHAVNGGGGSDLGNGAVGGKKKRMENGGIVIREAFGFSVAI